jgi:tRNA A37 threonylcarbamoyladenosine synthetase subunit TsaC/SUA5/YrdC
LSNLIKKIIQLLVWFSEFQNFAEVDMIANEIWDKYKNDLSALIDKWSPNVEFEKSKKKSRLLDWLNNFESFDECETVLPILNCIDIVSESYIKDLLEKFAYIILNLFGDDIQSVRIFSLGDTTADSGEPFLYYLKKKLGDEAVEKCFPKTSLDELDIEAEMVKALIFIDDIIGSGKQAIKYFNKNLIRIPIEKYYFSLFGFKNGFKKVEEIYGSGKVKVGKFLNEEDKAFSPKSKHFKDPIQREQIKAVCEKWGRKLYPKGPLGYEDCQGLVVFPYTVPNNTLPIIWAGRESESIKTEFWNPLFVRIKKEIKEEFEVPIVSSTIITRGIRESDTVNFKPYDLKITSQEALTFKELEKIEHLLKMGGICLLPSDTGYSLAVLPVKESIEKLDLIYPERSNEPKSLSFNSPRLLEKYVKLVEEEKKIIREFPRKPGTLVCQIVDGLKDKFSELLSTKPGTLGIRIPDSVVERQICEHLNNPITTYAIRDDSNNIIQKYDDAFDIIFDRLKKINIRVPIFTIKTSSIKYPEHSTVLSVHPLLTDGESAKIFREGLIDEKEILKWLNSF